MPIKVNNLKDLSITTFKPDYKMSTSEMESKNAELQKVAFALMEQEDEYQKLFLELTLQLDLESNLAKVQDIPVHFQEKENEELDDAKSQVEAWEAVIKNSDVIAVESHDHSLLYSEIENLVNEISHLTESNEEVRKELEKTNLENEKEYDCIQLKQAHNILSSWQSKIFQLQSYEDTLSEKIKLFQVIEMEMSKLSLFAKVVLTNSNVSPEEKLQKMEDTLETIKAISEDILKMKNELKTHDSEIDIIESSDQMKIQTMEDTLELLRFDNAHLKEQTRHYKSLLEKFWIDNFGIHWKYE